MAEGEGQELARVGRKEEDERSPEVVGCKHRKLRDLTSKDDISKARYPRSMKKKLMVDGGGRLLISGQLASRHRRILQFFRKVKGFRHFLSGKKYPIIFQKRHFSVTLAFFLQIGLCV
jgi:hypothetical protein